MLYAGIKSAAGVGKSKSSCAAACAKYENPVCAIVGLEMRDYDNKCLAECEYVPVSVCPSDCLFVCLSAQLFHHRGSMGHCQ